MLDDVLAGIRSRGSGPWPTWRSRGRFGVPARKRERLFDLGKALAGVPRSELSVDGDSIRVMVADELDREFELEVDGGEMELEIELKWSHAAASASSALAKIVKNTRQSDDGG
jgi:amphi-Trp domain-containing protein